MQFSEFFVPLPVESLRSVYRGATASALFACLPSSGTLHLVVRVVIPKYTSPLLTLRLAPLPSDPEFVAPSFTLRGESPELPSPMAACCFVFWLDKFWNSLFNTLPSITRQAAVIERSWLALLVLCRSINLRSAIPVFSFSTDSLNVFRLFLFSFFLRVCSCLSSFLTFTVFTNGTYFYWRWRERSFFSWELSYFYCLFFCSSVLCSNSMLTVVLEKIDCCFLMNFAWNQLLRHWPREIFKLVFTNLYLST